MHVRTSILIAVALFIALLLPTKGSAYPSGFTGRTLKSSTAGCGSCHGSSPSSSVTVSITGPSSVTAGQSASFTVSVTGTSGSAGGVDIAVKNGSLAPVSSFLKLTGGELTHNTRVAVPSTYQFTYTAPASPGTDTLYATGKDNNMNSWNWAPNKAVTITSAAPAAPAAPALASPANGATNQATTPTLAWNASTGATTYRLQVSTSSSFASTVFDDSTLTGVSRQIGPLSNSTVYYWRVRAKNSGGSSAYSSAWSFTTAAPPATPPPTPALASPANGATNQATTLTLGWNASTGATTYRLQVSTSSSFATTVFDDSTLTGVSRQIGPLSNSATYYWRVNAKGTGGTSAYSGAWSFTTAAPPATPPPTPALASPANGAANQATTLTLAWNASTGATTYRLQVSTSSSFASTVFDDSTLTGVSRQIGPLSNSVTYYWRVNAKGTGGTSAYSGAWSFTTAAPPATPPPTPALASPANGSTNQATTLTLGWNASTGATTYRLQVSTSSSFASTVFDDSTLTGVSRQIGPLSNSATYYWRVNAKNTAGTSAYSGSWSFTTNASGGTTPPVPIQDSPDSGATRQSTSPTFDWKSSLGATRYRLQLALDSKFVTLVFDDSNITTSYRLVSQLRNSTRYYWHVRAENATGYSDYSPTWSLTTARRRPGIPHKRTPEDRSEGLGRSLTFTWDSTLDASTYKLQVATDSHFASKVSAEKVVSGTSAQITGLSAKTTYYWRVQAANEDSVGEWSSNWEFSTSSVTGVSDQSTLPSAFVLEQNYPNPFNPSTHIGYSIPENSHVTLTVYDVNGTKVATLIDGWQNAGRHDLQFDAHRLTSGTYFYTLQAGNFSETRMLMLLK